MGWFAREQVLDASGVTKDRVSSTESMIGKIGRVTGPIAAKRMGEVMVPIRGGTEAFHAYAEDDTAAIAVGARVVIIEYHPPRTVIVAPA